MQDLFIVKVKCKSSGGEREREGGGRKEGGRGEEREMQDLFILK